jgi:hypothetical protein
MAVRRRPVAVDVAAIAAFSSGDPSGPVTRPTRTSVPAPACAVARVTKSIDITAHHNARVTISAAM